MLAAHRSSAGRAQQRVTHARPGNANLPTVGLNLHGSTKERGLNSMAEADNSRSAAEADSRRGGSRVIWAGRSIVHRRTIGGATRNARKRQWREWQADDVDEHRSWPVRTFQIAFQNLHLERSQSGLSAYRLSSLSACSAAQPSNPAQTPTQRRQPRPPRSSATLPLENSTSPSLPHYTPLALRQ